MIDAVFITVSLRRLASERIFSPAIVLTSSSLRDMHECVSFVSRGEPDEALGSQTKISALLAVI